MANPTTTPKSTAQYPTGIRENPDAGICIYCGRMVADNTIVPARADGEAWDELASEHDAGCEWIATRAHRQNL